jgi:secondary thiamine-phosphate synthase enzyme
MILLEIVEIRVKLYVLKYKNYDMPAHLKSSVIGAEVTIPVTRHRLNLGTWQGIYFCEFRNYGGTRRLVLTVFS